MGGGRKQTPTIDESSSGFHLVELHGTSYGMGFGSFFLIVICGIMGWLFYKKCCQSRNVNTVATMSHIPSVSYTPGAVSLPMHYPLQQTDSFSALEQQTIQQQPLQMLENAFNNLMSRALTTRNDQSDLGITRNSDAFSDRLGNLSDSSRISEQPTDENG